MSKNALNDVLSKIAQADGKDTETVKSEIEKAVKGSEIFKGMQWDEIITFCTCMAVLKGGYKDIFVIDCFKLT